MLFIHNRRFLCKCKSVYEKNRVLKNLKNEKIECVCKTKGTNARIVTSMEDVIWFNVYVSKSNYEKAKKLIHKE